MDRSFGAARGPAPEAGDAGSGTDGAAAGDAPPGWDKPVRARATQPRATATRSRVLAAARSLFAERGYHVTGTNDVVAMAGVTRGALYHHFATKEALFEAVYRVVARALADDAVAQTRELRGRTWARTIASLRAYLGLVASRQEVQRIVLTDAPAVLGWARWRELQAEFRLAEWQETLRMLEEQRLIRAVPREETAHLLLAMIDDAALTVAHAADPPVVIDRVRTALEVLLGGLRRGAGEDA